MTRNVHKLDTLLKMSVLEGDKKYLFRIMPTWINMSHNDNYINRYFKTNLAHPLTPWWFKVCCIWKHVQNIWTQRAKVLSQEDDLSAVDLQCQGHFSSHPLQQLLKCICILQMLVVCHFYRHAFAYLLAETIICWMVTSAVKCYIHTYNFDSMENEICSVKFIVILSLQTSACATKAQL